MKLATLALVAGAVLAAAPLATADAAVVRKTVISYHGAFGHGCRTVRVVHRGPFGRHVDVRRSCR